MAIEIFSPAKVNWTLDIFPKNLGEDFHRLDTIYQKISLGDFMRISEADVFEIVGDFSCAMEKNLIYRAWGILREFYPDLPCFRVEVEKYIPEKGGLGGGSSNAGSFVRGILGEYDLMPSPALLMRLGDLGKDVPFFCFEDSVMRGRGFGEILEKFPRAPLCEGGDSFDRDFEEKYRENFVGKKFYIYRPDFENDTGEMYGRLGEIEGGFNSGFFTGIFLENPSFENTGNGFDVFLQDEKYQKIFPEKFWESAHGMSGSGSCVWNKEEFEIEGVERWEVEVL